MSREEPPQNDSKPSYQHLSPVTQKVSRRIIKGKWDRLGPAAVDSVSKIVDDVQKASLAYFSNDERIGASKILGSVCRKLMGKISKGVPFPPPLCKSREDDFDFEKILDQSRALDAAISKVTDTNKSLESAVEDQIAYPKSASFAFCDLRYAI